MDACAHCGQPAPDGRRFCCPGCATAFDTIQTLGLGSYYARCIAERPPRPETFDRFDLTRFVTEKPDGTKELVLAVDGLRCGACVWLIESVLGTEASVVTGRVNMTSRRLRLVWNGPISGADRLVGRIETLGYRLVPFDPAALEAARGDTDRALIRALAVAGFAAINVMLMSIGIWAGEASGLLAGMGPATRDLLHYVSALIALPAIAYAGMPFFRAALGVLRHGRTSMDVPVSIGIILVTGLSLTQTMTHGRDTYFDSAVMLLFFLLVGRVLDHRARGQMRAAVELLLVLRSADVNVLLADGTVALRQPRSLVVGDHVLIGMGERIGVDGMVESGESSVDASLVTGEALPVPVAPGARVFAGTMNLGAPLTVRVTAAEDATVLAECARLIEAAEARKSRFVMLADRVARRYAPAVHLMALAAFLGWYVWGGLSFGQALLIAISVLIVTCPCALALAVPAVQVIATTKLFRAGILLKSGTALERLAEVNTVVFDKTGTLTEPSLALTGDGIDKRTLRAAASLATHSRHPLARALCAAAGPVAGEEGVEETPGMGVATSNARLGSAAFVGVEPGGGTEMWFVRSGQPPVRFSFAEKPRHDAAETIARLRAMGLKVRLLSGDRAASVARVAAAVGIADWLADCSPVEKVAVLRGMGGHVLMVGDGLNDGPSLAEALVSASPSTAADISQTIADAVFQGAGLGAIATLIVTARRTRRLMRGNIGLALVYNLAMVPLAAAGFVTPWLAAAAMSGSSLVVIGNSFRART